MMETLTAADVARGFRHSLGWFYRNRVRLEARGFPVPVDGLGLRWDPAAIDAWLNAQLPAVKAAAVPEDGADILIRRAQQMAA
jgi:hypothetical protein